MGQAWCKEKTTRAQDSKSPLDRVFVRCAHRIYPGLKDEGSVLGGATQRVTSSEIGYAGSPPRHVLARGRSIDSVDRPFHPSDWVDVNLEAPSTPRTSSAFTNLTLDTSLHPATTPTSSYSNLQDAAPVPPPRRRGKRNKDRPLPPKPDEVPGSVFGKLKRVDTNEEPFYTSVKPPPEAGGDEGREGGEDVVDGERTRESTKDLRNDEKRSKEIYEHKVNGTGRIIPSDVVSGKRSSYHGNSASRAAESNRRKRNREDEEYERFARSRSVQDSSTPNRQTDEKSNENAGKNEESKERTKNLSTVSLPNYNELEIVQRTAEVNKDERTKETTKETRRINSAGSLNTENSPSPRSQARRAYLEDRRGKSETEDVEFLKYDPKKLEDWDLSDVSNCDSTHRQRSYQSSPTSEIIGENVQVDSLGNSPSNDVVDGKNLSKNVNLPKSPIMQKPESFGKTSTELDKNSASSMNVDQWIAGQNSHSRYFDPPTMAMCKISSNCDDKISSTNGEPFFLVEKNPRSKTGETVDGPATSFGSSSRLFERRLSNESEPFADSYEEKELCRLGSAIPGKMVKTISDESLPREMLDSGDENDEDFFAERSARAVRRETGKERADSGIAKTPSPSPEPRIRPEIQENDHSCLLKVLKEEGADGSNLSSMTPSLTELEAALSDLLEKDGAENDVKRGEGGTRSDPLVPSEPADQGLEGRDPSSSSDLAEKPAEKSVDGSATIFRESSTAVEKPCEETLENSKSGSVSSPGLPESPIEPSIKVVKKPSADEPIETGSKGDELNENLVDDDFGETQDDLTSLTRNPVETMPMNRKVSFCAWEESTMMEIDLTNRGESISEQENSEADLLGISRRSEIPEEPPEKPSRLYRTGPEEMADKSGENVVPTPPRRKNRSNQSVFNHSQKVGEKENVESPRVFNDRLI